MEKTSPSSAPWLAFSEKCYPKQRIFLSIDAIGSTKLKTYCQENVKDGLECYWQNSILSFLSDAHIYFQGFANEIKMQCKKSWDKRQCDTCSNTDIWKYIGDEIIICTELKCVFEPLVLLHALRKTLLYLNNKAEQKQKEEQWQIDSVPYLQYKGTAWVAGFPVTNTDVIINKKISEYSKKNKYLTLILILI